MPSNVPHSFILLVLVPLIAWRVYRRVRRNIGRQPLGTVRPWFTLVLFPLILAALAFGVVSVPQALLALGAGVLIGIVLGIVGLRLTRFENTGQGLFYTPNVHLGIALSLLLTGRILWRLVPFLGGGDVVDPGPDAFMRSPLTLLLFGTLAGYYVTYAAGLIRWRLGQRALPIAGQGS